MSSFKNQIAVVTGATGGIGGAIAADLARGGAHVLLVGRNREKLAARAEQFHATSFPMDLIVDGDIDRFTEFVETTYGRLDILVHSAGALAHGNLEDAGVDAFDRLFAVNVRGPYLLTQKLLHLLKKPHGQVVFINSSAGLTARAQTGQYSANKHALRAIADALRDEVNADGIRVLSVYPGRTVSEQIMSLHAREGRPYRPDLLLQPEDIASVVTNALALPRTAEVTDLRIRPLQKSY